MKLLALDLALRSSGWAIGYPGMNRPTWGLFKTKDWDGNEEHHVHRFWLFLCDLHDQHALTHIAYEDVFVNAKRYQHNGTQGQQFFVAIILLFCKINGVKPYRVPISTWRSWFVPGQPPSDLRSLLRDQFPSLKAQNAENGRRARLRRKWWKQRAIDECATRGWEVSKDDEAEALAIMDFALGALDPHHRGATDPIFHAVAP